MDLGGARKYHFGDRMAPGSVHEPGPALLGADLCSSGLEKEVRPRLERLLRVIVGPLLQFMLSLLRDFLCLAALSYLRDFVCLA